MERFVFVAAVTLAILFGVGAMFHNSFHFNMDLDEEGFGVSPVVALSSGTMAAQTYAGTGIEIKAAAANVTVIPEDRQDFSVEIDNSAGLAPMPLVSIEGDRVIVDGQLRGRISSCGETVNLRGYGSVAADQLPRITIRAPRALSLDRGGAGTTEIGATESLDLDVTGCGAVTVGDVAGAFELDLAGAGEVTGGSVRHFTADVAGAGDIRMGAVAEGAELDISGAGSVVLASLNGDLSLDSAGAGDVDIQGGSVGVAEVDMAGTGELDIAGPVQTLTVSLMGVGQVDVAGAVGDLDVDIAGPGSVSVASVTGSVRQDIAGPGDVNIGSRGAQNAP